MSAYRVRAPLSLKIMYLSLISFFFLYSSSWDSSARVWNVNTPQMSPIILKGHQAAVWAALELKNATFATASADKSIKLWRKDGALISTLTGKRMYILFKQIEFSW